MKSIYLPAEDSFFFAEILHQYFKEHAVSSFLDMGTGSTVLAEVAAEYIDKEKILTLDINENAVALAISKGFQSIHAHLFSAVAHSFDLIVFNAPYLPKDEREPLDSQTATTGGARGDEISVEFLREAQKHLNREGAVLLLVSSLTPLDRIEKFKPKVIARKKIDWEELLILKFQN